ncbi:MAG: TonB-dependent receptor plug domain-containing protein [Chitinophagaceae bacterium]|nr:TonB-dependent receptor plug domain-containing protein [Chitinophagaceae bacterium]MBP7109498.1 TonB-dependent receptor plug domain-containing protein [Chitinophagaceae bacterium]MBP7314409.1 TonB-dependent receptor plug domain-containing protein [Chitinophagaceae bacterium]
MKRIMMLGCFLVTANAIFSQEVKDSFYSLTPVEVRAIRAGENAPFTKTNISRKEIAKTNLGQDIPFLLNQTPAVVINSDAGNGVGYTGIRIRGSDAARINVTLNGIPYNDAESQGTFFVDLPDFSSSTGSIQIQRGVGTSSNGAGAFGGNINISTNEVIKESYAEINNSFGSFNTWKHTIKAGTGLVNGFTTDLRLSKINSDGFIDRASSDLKSFYFSTAYAKEKTSVRVNIFSGKEKTYQAWNGISEADLLAGNRTLNSAGTERPGEPYDNEVDDYTQTHYQLFFSQRLNSKLNFNTAFFLTKGKGFYEQFKADQKYSSYRMPDAPSGTRSDMVRQLWLDNDFYGNIFSLQLKNKQTEAVLGGGFTRYNGQHFGKVIWAAKGLTGVDNWYDLDSDKKDFNIYLKQQTQIAGNWNLFYDLQYRHVKYSTEGFRDNPTLSINKNFNFFNPKAGVSYIKNGWKAYTSYSIANKEPNRDDFEAGALQQPLPERLHDIEAGIKKQTSNYNWAATVYFMNYENQLVLDGKINDVGAYIRTNIPNSYRLGIELQGAIKFNSWMNAAANISLSENKVKNFTEYIDDYDNGGQKTNNFSSATIAYSPSVVGGATINFIPVKNGELSLLSKYVSKQYLDNTSNNARSLNAFFVQDVRAIYTIKNKGLKEINIIAQLNNVFGKKYEPNGYSFSYFVGGETVTENYYFPMAGRNFMLGLNISL